MMTMTSRMIPASPCWWKPLLLVIVLCCTSFSEALPSGFEDQGLLRIDRLVDIKFGKDLDGNHIAYGVTKPGKLHLITNFDGSDPDDAEEEEILDLEDLVCDDRERGLTGLELHYDFPDTNWIYLFYTRRSSGSDGCDGARNHVVRYRVNKNDFADIQKSSEQILLRTPRLEEAIHNSGDMHFGVDKMLYVTIGDDGNRKDGLSQQRNHLFGKMLRITETGDIPNSGNPYTGSNTAPCGNGDKLSSNKKCQEIFSYGLRNPFRFTMDPHSRNKVRYLINDVGAKTWEETSEGGEGYAGANYGWPIVEGPCDYNEVKDCPVYSEFVDPIFWYEHNSDDNGAAVGIAISPPGLNWPSKYLDSFFVEEYDDGVIYQVSPPGNNDRGCRDCEPPIPSYTKKDFHDYERVVALQFGPYKRNGQTLYYTTRSGSVTFRRIVYKGDNGSNENNAPIADFTMSDTIIPVGGEVEVDASDSYDPDPNEQLTYEWDFGDGTSLEYGKREDHTYDEGGTYEIKLIVTDSKGFSDTERKTISVGNPPSVRIVQPEEGTMFAVGDLFRFVGEGTDSDGKDLDGPDLEWEVQQHHGGHFHPFFSGTGTTTTIPAAPEPEDFSAAGNSYLKVLLTGTDDIGLATTVILDIMPKLVHIDFDTNPSGLELSVDEQTIVTPYRVLTWENHNLRVIAPRQGRYTFSSWSNGKSDNDIFKIPTGRDSPDEIPVYSYVATFEQGKETQSFEVVGDDKEPSSAFPLQACQGDCDGDGDCSGSLKCFKRSRNEEVTIPGCGTIKLEESTDFCYDDGEELSAGGDPKIDKVGNNGTPSDVFPLGLCEGDCDDDDECEASLVCFKRKDEEAVPGCSGSDKFSGKDFCINPETGPETGSSNFEVVGDNKEPSSAFPLKKCQGDCDGDGDCADGLKCWKRSRKEEVFIPGCGTIKLDESTDFCYEP